MNGLAWFLAGPFVYIAVIVFVVVAGGKILSYLKMPRHFRWDLYPVPHQGPAGSKYQKVDFYQAPYEVSKIHELKDMGQEMLFIKKALINNPTLWKGSFPLHAGLYLLGMWFVLLLVGAVSELMGIQIEASGSLLAAAIYYATLAAGAAGLIAGLCGTLILLWLRYSDEGLRDMATFITYFNLYIMLFLFGSGLLCWLMADADFSLIRHHLASLILFSPANPPVLVAVEMLALGIFLIWLPFSQMLHFAAKYFFYHNIMWDDEPMKPDSKMSQDIGGYLHYQVDWSASHMKKSGSWFDQVTKDEAPQKQGGESNNDAK